MNDVMNDVADDAIPEGLPAPVLGKNRLTATERAAEDRMPLPPLLDPGVSALPPALSVVPAADRTEDLDLDDIGAAPAPVERRRPSSSGSDNARAVSRQKKRGDVAVEQPSSGDIPVVIPRSVVDALRADPRSRATVFRAAFSYHAPAVVDAQPPRPEPVVTGMRVKPERRKAEEGDPFVEVLFRLDPDQKALFLTWVAKTSLTASAFATELLRLELNCPDPTRR